MTAITIAPHARTLQLTRRGRAVRNLAVLAGVTVALMPVAVRVTHAVGQATTPGLVTVGTTTVTITVNEGDSLWSIARRTFPDRDPRSVVSDIREVNHMRSNLIHPGEVLRLPS